MLLLYYLFDVQLISSLPQYLLTMLGLSIIVTPAPGTIWYVSMLLLFYAITPLLLFKSSSQKGKIVLKSAMVYGIFLFLTVTQISSVDERLYYLFPVYCAGLVIGRKKMADEKCRPLFLVLGLSAFIGLSSLFHIGEMKLGVAIVYTLGVIVVFVVFIMEFGKLFTGRMEKILEKVSYASMCAYLFHRQIYGVLAKFLGDFSVVEAVVSFLCVMVICYYIQLIYDWARKKVG